jgi:tetratricopeptide (TPR) repeat protein
MLASVAGPLLLGLLGPGLPLVASGADSNATQLVTTEMGARIRPEVDRQLARAVLLTPGRPDDALALLEPLRAGIQGESLNYWEAFEVCHSIGEAQRWKRDYREARTTLEDCLNFTDIEPERRRKALTSLGKVYVQLKDAEKALDVYEELNRMHGGRDPQLLAHIAQIYAVLLGDRGAAIPYLEAAIRYETGNPKRGNYQKLRAAYQRNGDLENALEIAKAMVDLFDEPDDEQAMDEIVAAMNERLR